VGEPIDLVGEPMDCVGEPMGDPHGDIVGEPIVAESIVGESITIPRQGLHSETIQTIKATLYPVSFSLDD